MRVSSNRAPGNAHFLPSTLNSKLKTSRQSASARRSMCAAIEIKAEQKKEPSQRPFSSVLAQCFLLPAVLRLVRTLFEMRQATASEGDERVGGPESSKRFSLSLSLSKKSNRNEERSGCRRSRCVDAREALLFLLRFLFFRLSSSSRAFRALEELKNARTHTFSAPQERKHRQRRPALCRRSPGRDGHRPGAPRSRAEGGSRTHRVPLGGGCCQRYAVSLSEVGSREYPCAM